MLNVIRTAAQSDPRLAVLYEKAEEYASIYLMAKERQRGCDGLGELNNLKDEVRCVFDEMAEYCRLSLPEGCDLSDTDMIIDELNNMSAISHRDPIQK